MKQRKGHCRLCGIRSETVYCDVCTGFIKTGRWLSEDIDVESLLTFMTEVWGEEMTLERTQDVIDNDPTIAYAQDMMRGTGGSPYHKVIG